MGILTPAQTPNHCSIILDNQLLCGAFTAITPWPCRLPLHHIHQVRPFPHAGVSLTLCSCFNHPPSELVCCSPFPSNLQLLHKWQKCCNAPFLQFLQFFLYITAFVESFPQTAALLIFNNWSVIPEVQYVEALQGCFGLMDWNNTLWRGQCKGLPSWVTCQCLCGFLNYIKQ